MNPAVPAFSAGTRFAGAVLLTGYLTGLVPGLVMSLVGALALMTLGKALLLERHAATTSVAALAIIAGALGVPALRWGTLSIEGLVGVQSVLGPTVLVGPAEVAGASIAAGCGALLAIAVWIREPRATRTLGRVWDVVEIFLAAASVTIVFAAPDSGGGVGELLSAGTALSIAVAVGVGVLAWLLARALGSRSVRWILLGAAAVAVIGGAGVAAVSV